MTLDIDTRLKPASRTMRPGNRAAPSIAKRPRLPSLRKALTDRLAGPGGLYNLGNLIGLGQGIALQILASGDGHSVWSGAPGAVADYLAGNGAAIAMTAATAIFFVSGEVYHRAWSGSLKPDDRLNRLGDFLSGVGAVCLGLALFELGHPVLALTAGLLHSVGKFGSAFHAVGERIFKGVQFIPDPFRTMVLLSRLPALAAAGYDLIATLFQTNASVQAHWSTSATLVVCYLLWSFADLLLFRSSRPATEAGGSAT